MKSYLRKLKAYIKANPTMFDDDCPLPALDSLYWHYTECHTMTNEKTKLASRNLSAHLRFLPPKRRDTIYCLAHARKSRYQQNGEEYFYFLCHACNANCPFPQSALRNSLSFLRIFIQD